MVKENSPRGWRQGHKEQWTKDLPQKSEWALMKKLATRDPTSSVPVQQEPTIVGGQGLFCLPFFPFLKTDLYCGPALSAVPL